jgi:hypothetical protein
MMNVLNILTECLLLLFGMKRTGIVAARDRFGEKPFYHFNKSNLFLLQMSSLGCRHTKKANLKCYLII